MNVLVVSTAVTGHLNPLLAAASILNRHGHTVAVKTSRELKPLVDAVGLQFSPESEKVESIEKYFQNYPEQQALEPGMATTGFALQYYFARNMPAQFQSLSEALLTFPADLVLADSFYWGTLPLLARPRGQRPAVAHLGITVLDFGSGRNLPERENEGMSKRRERLMLRPAQSAIEAELAAMGLPSLPCPILESMSRMADVYLHPGISSFEYPGFENANSKIHYIGSLPLPPSNTPLPTWWTKLDIRKKRVLVTQGTIANRDLGQLIGPALTALAGELDIEVVVTTGNQPLASIPVPIPENARVAPFLPFDRILSEVDLLISNGGYGTVNMALERGIPLVIAGLTEDKEEVAAHVQWAGVGLDLRTNRPEAEQLRHAVRHVLDKSTFRQRAEELAEEFASHDTERELLEHLESAVMGSGSPEMDYLQH